MTEKTYPVPLLLDGGTGSELIRRGLPAGVCTEQWLTEHPQAILDVQRRYFAAGADAVLTPTFHCNSLSLAGYGLADRTESLNGAMAALSRQAAGKTGLVLGDLSPAAVLLEPLGDCTYDRVLDAYGRQVRALSAAGVDGYLIETAMSLAEVRALVLAIRDNEPEIGRKPLFVTVTVGRNGRTQLTGSDALSCLIVLQAMGVTAFGLNCSLGPAPASGALGGDPPDRQAQRGHAAGGGGPDGLRLRPGGICRVHGGSGSERCGDRRGLLRHGAGTHCRPAPGAGRTGFCRPAPCEKGGSPARSGKRKARLPL